jgi:hypothetical protein
LEQGIGINQRNRKSSCTIGDFLGFVVIGRVTSNLNASEIDANKEQNASVNVDNNMTEENTVKDQ